MSFDQIMNVGDWADGFEGIGEVLSIHTIYSDEIDVINDSDRMLGEHAMDVVVYKMLCDFEGKLRKRSHFLSCNKSLCTPICEESRSVLEKIKAQEPEAYEKFKSLSPKKSQGEWHYLYLPSDDRFHSHKDRIEEVATSISKPFSYMQYKEALKGVGFDIGCKYIETSIEKQYVTLSFYNEGYLHKNNERLYSRVNCTVVGPYA